MVEGLGTGGASMAGETDSESESESLPLEDVQSSSAWGLAGWLDVGLIRDGIAISGEVPCSIVLRRFVGLEVDMVPALYLDVVD